MKPSQLLRARSSAIWLTFALGCTSGGSRSDAPAGAGAGAAPNGPGEVPVGAHPGGVMVSCDQAAKPGVSPLLRLSTRQYRNTVRDLLASVGASALLPRIDGALASIPDDSLSDGFRGRDNRTALEHVQGYFNVGRAVGDALANDAALLSAVAGRCASEASLSTVCVDGFFDKFVRLAYRRPLEEAERAGLGALNDGARTPAQALRAMVVVALSSPRFVHHLEVDERLRRKTCCS